MKEVSKLFAYFIRLVNTRQIGSKFLNQGQLFHCQSGLIHIKFGRLFFDWNLNRSFSRSVHSVKNQNRSLSRSISSDKSH